MLYDIVFKMGFHIKEDYWWIFFFMSLITFSLISKVFVHRVIPFIFLLVAIDDDHDPNKK